MIDLGIEGNSSFGVASSFEQDAGLPGPSAASYKVWYARGIDLLG